MDLLRKAAAKARAFLQLGQTGRRCRLLAEGVNEDISRNTAVLLLKLVQAGEQEFFLRRQRVYRLDRVLLDVHWLRDGHNLTRHRLRDHRSFFDSCLVLGER